MTLSKEHEELKNGIGKCSVPMWMGGMPAGFCDNEAYSKRPGGNEWYNEHTREWMRFDGKYNGYVPALACPIHGGLEKKEALNLCDFCKHDFAICKSQPKFGCGRGNDNVYECDIYEPKTA